MSYLLDANTVIAAIQGRLPVVLRLAKLKPGQVAISVITQIEVEAALRRAGRVNAKFNRLLREFLASIKLLDFGAAEATQAINLTPYLPSGTEALTAHQVLLSATALAHQLTLVTDQTPRFATIPGLELENWSRPL